MELQVFLLLSTVRGDQENQNESIDNSCNWQNRYKDRGLKILYP